MQEQAMAEFYPPKATKADSIPRRRVFMMGGGTPVPPERSRKFCESLVDGCLDAGVRGLHDFVLGFAACLDAISRGTIDLEERPVNVALQAYADVHNVTTTPNKITDIMRFGD